MLNKCVPGKSKSNKIVKCYAASLMQPFFSENRTLPFVRIVLHLFQSSAYTCGGKAVNEGNFLELVRLLAKYNGILAHHLVTAPKNANYLSPQIQSQFIDVNDALAGTVKARIVSEVKSACYYGVIMDSTIDVSHTDQLS